MARLIRGAGAGAHLEPAEVWDARVEAARLVRQARLRAREVVERALSEAESIRAAAEDEGGKRAWAEVAGARIAVESARRAARVEAREDVVRLALAAARRIVAEEIRLAPERVEALVRGVLASAPYARTLRLRVHPGDVERARAVGEAHAPEAALAVVPDATLEPGDCVLETEGGSVDARIAVQLEVLAEQLLEGR